MCGVPAQIYASGSSPYRQSVPATQGLQLQEARLEKVPRIIIPGKFCQSGPYAAINSELDLHTII